MKTVDLTIIILSLFEHTSTVFYKIFNLTNNLKYDIINYNKRKTLCQK